MINHNAKVSNSQPRTIKRDQLRKSEAVRGIWVASYDALSTPAKRVSFIRLDPWKFVVSAELERNENVTFSFVFCLQLFGNEK